MRTNAAFVGFKHGCFCHRFFRRILSQALRTEILGTRNEGIIPVFLFILLSASFPFQYNRLRKKFSFTLKEIGIKTNWQLFVKILSCHKVIFRKPNKKITDLAVMSFYVFQLLEMFAKAVFLCFTKSWRKVVSIGPRQTPYVGSQRGESVKGENV